MTRWPDIPDGAILSLRRRANNGKRQQWVITSGVNDVIVRHSRLKGGSWHDSGAGDRCQDLADALRCIPGLGALQRGFISEYTVDSASWQPAVLVSRLQIPAGESAENPDDWPAEVADEWADRDDALAEWAPQLPWVPRWATVNGIRVSGIDVGRYVQPVLVDENKEQLVPIRVIARSSSHSESCGTGVISWAGGNTLSLLAPGLGYSHPWGDSTESDDCADQFLALPDRPAQLGRRLAEWVIDTHTEVAAALALEPLDIDGTLDDEERRGWKKAIAEVPLSLDVQTDADVLKPLRENLALLSDLYRRTRDSLAWPGSDDGRVLAQSLGDGPVNGAVSRLASGDWGP
jgi:hypothetical protein